MMDNRIHKIVHNAWNLSISVFITFNYITVKIEYMIENPEGHH